MIPPCVGTDRWLTSFRIVSALPLELRIRAVALLELVLQIVLQFPGAVGGYLGFRPRHSGSRTAQRTGRALGRRSGCECHVAVTALATSLALERRDQRLT